MISWRASLLFFLWAAIIVTTAYAEDSKIEGSDGSRISGEKSQRGISHERRLISALSLLLKNSTRKNRCTDDKDCPNNQFCKNRNVIFLKSYCENRKSHGMLCSRNRECAGGFCSTGRCGECISDSHCPSGKFCHHRNIPVADKRCKKKLPNRKICDRNTMCASGKCVNFICCSACLPQLSIIKNKCMDDEDCPSDQYCRYRNLPIKGNECASKKRLGSLCSRKEECADGFCAVGRCSQCINDGDCPTGRFCRNRNVPLIAAKKCTPKKRLGSLCSRKEECADGFCADARCGQCINDEDCPTGNYCKNRKLPLITNNCKPKKCRGSCSRNAMCKSGKCRLFFCKRC